MNNRRILSITTLARLMLRRYLRDRTALFFTIVFPLIFLIIFGGLFGKDSDVSFTVDVINQSNSAVAASFASHLEHSSAFKVKSTTVSVASATTLLNEGQLDAIIVFPPDFGDPGAGHLPTGTLTVYDNQNNAQEASIITSVFDGIITQVNQSIVPYHPLFTLHQSGTASKYVVTPFDYTFAGLLGFSILTLGIFGPANTFPEARRQGILRRLRATPLRSGEFIVANALAYAGIGAIALTIMMLVGFLFFNLSMVGNYAVFIPFLLLGVLELFGIGMGIGGWARNQQQAAPVTNLVSFPMMFLSGTFFPTYIMPVWLQDISRFLPLSPVIDGIRRIITENAGFPALGGDILLMAAWTVIIYVTAFTLFRWE